MGRLNNNNNEDQTMAKRLLKAFAQLLSLELLWNESINDMLFPNAIQWWGSGFWKLLERLNNSQFFY